MDRTRTGYAALIVGLALGLTLVTGSAPRGGNSPLNGDEASRLTSNKFTSFFAEPLPYSTDEMARWNMPAEKVYKNIQSFRGKTAGQLMGAMEFIGSALGVRCGYCHVQGDFSLDDKPAKKTARTMIQMTSDINNRNFGDVTVTCYTCHRGSSMPVSVPSLTQNTWQSLDAAETIASLPGDSMTVDQVLAKYVQALGGEAALKRVTTRVLKVSEAQPEGPATSVDIYQKSPDKLFVSAMSSDPKRGGRIEGYNGNVGWAQFGNRKPSPVMNNDLVQLRRYAEFFPAFDLRSRFTDVKLLGKQKLGDHEVYVVSAMASDSSRDRLYFDAKTGLLVHRYVEYKSILGYIPFSIDYSDYREADGVRIPYKLQWSAPRENWTDTITELRQNIPVEDAKFAMPSAK